ELTTKPVAGVLPNETAVAPVKFDPLIEIVAPAAADEGLTDVTIGYDPDDTVKELESARPLATESWYEPAVGIQRLLNVAWPRELVTSVVVPFSDPDESPIFNGMPRPTVGVVPADWMAPISGCGAA